MSSRTSTARPNVASPAGKPSRRLFPRLRDARIRTKLSLILVVPVLTIVGLAAIRLVDSGRRAIEADLVSGLTSLSADVSALTHELHRERMTAAALLGVADRSPEAFNQQAVVTDERTARYTRARQALGELPAGVTERLRRIDEHLATLDGTRQEVLARQGASVAQVVLRYGVILTDLVAYREEIGQIAGDTDLADSLRAAAAFSKAKLAASEEQAVTYAALRLGRLDDEQFSSFVATLTSQQESFVAFALSATNAQRALVNSTVSGDAVHLADRMAAELTRTVGTTPNVTAEQVSNAIGAVTDLMRWAELRIDERLVAEAGAVRNEVLTLVAIESSVVLVTLVVAVALALLLARSMARSLGRLREGALGVAQRDLPDAVAQLRDVRGLGDTTPEEIAAAVRDPIQLTSRDEIGQVGRAFNVVHREAVRIAAEQAALRTSVSAMFLNLARRSQTLVDRMIGELDTIERTEEDPKRLARLFQLDHLATRMRRNDENLLVLAGADSSPPRRDDALLVDILRAAQSEVELYDRIEFGTVDTDVSVASHAVNDVVRLVAELLDNATRFSPPNTIVVADARRIGDYVLVQVEDHGLGLSDEQLNALNERLAEPSSVDVAAFRMMGLAVVARLAARYMIRIELRRNAEGGTVANVALPANILVLPRIRGREPLAMRRSPLAVEPTPMHGSRDWAPPTVAAAGAGPRMSAGMHANDAAAAAARSMPVAGIRPDFTSAAPAPDPPAAASGYPASPYPTESRYTDLAQAGYRPAGPPAVDDTTELPIFREIEAAWFRTQPPVDSSAWAYSPAPAPVSGAPVSGLPVSAPPFTTVTAGASYALRTPTGESPAYAGAPPAAYPPNPAAGYVPPPAYTPPAVPRQRAEAGAGREEVHWRTAADTGWQAASAAAEPRPAGTTRSGLPKRVPMDQLVPGGVGAAGGPSRARRTPEEVRGLLSAYHRGVQRGRSGGDLSTIVEPNNTKGATQ